MENQQTAPEALIKTVGEYASVNIKLVKLQAVNAASESGASLASAFILLMIINMALLLLSVGVGMWIGEYTGKMYYGFWAVGGFYTFAALLVFIFRRKWLKLPVRNMLVKKMLG